MLPIDVFPLHTHPLDPPYEHPLTTPSRPTPLNPSYPVTTGQCPRSNSFHREQHRQEQLRDKKHRIAEFARGRSPQLVR